jgi:GH18 family chitinase
MVSTSSTSGCIPNRSWILTCTCSWEYPGNQGIGCNTISPKDTVHLLSFLQELRSTAAGKKLYLTAAAPLSPWADKNGDPSTNLTGFAKVLDHIAIMKYVLLLMLRLTMY